MSNSQELPPGVPELTEFEMPFNGATYTVYAGPRDLVAYRLGAQRAAEARWMPIETAPKDGSKILLFYLNANGKARRIVGGWVTEDEAAETDTDDVGLEAGWYERIDNWPDYYQVAIHEGEPSHWMPLPTPPKEPDHG